MEIITTKTIDMLTKDAVSIITQQAVLLNGVKTQVGDNHRCAYMNSTRGREDLQATEPLDVVNSVLAMWGELPTINESGLF